MRRPAAILRTVLAAGCAAFAHGASAQDAPAAAPTVSIVTGISAGDILNIRAKAAPFGPVKSRVPNGTSLKNYGCADFNGYAWCKVEELGRPELVGWTPERYLRTADPAEAEAAIADAAAVQNTAAVGTPAEDMDAAALQPPDDAPRAAPAGTAADTAFVSLPARVAAAAAEKAVLPEPARTEPASAEASAIAAAASLAIAGTNAGNDAGEETGEAARLDAPLDGTVAFVKTMEPAAPSPGAQAVKPAPSAAEQKPRPRLTAWDKMALAGRALIVGDPAKAAEASEQAAVAMVEPPAPAKTGTPPALAQAAPGAVSARTAPPPPVVVKTTVIPALAPPTDLSERLGGESDQPGAAATQQQSAAAIGQTANEDAYALAFAAQDNPAALGAEQKPAADRQGVVDDTDATLPAEAVTVPTSQPGMPENDAMTETQVVATSPPAGQDMPLAGTIQGDAIGEIPCARYFGQPMVRCEAKVVRTDADTADVTVAWPDGGTRIINFRTGKAAGSNARGAFKLTREADLNMIRIGTAERFEILDAFVFGG